MKQRLMSRLAALVFLVLASCGGSSTSESGSGSGDLNVWLTDAASPEYKAVYISVHQVEIKASSDDNDNGWQVVDGVDKTINLLELTGGILESLGSQNFSAQTYNQLRLVLATDPDDQTNLNGDDHPFANYVIETDDTNDTNDTNDIVHELKVPSGYQSGIKLVKQFAIKPSGLTELILDFDVMKSVVKAGNSGQWLLKPVIEVLDTETVAGIGGSVTDSPTPGTSQQAAWVSVQTYEGFAPDPKDKITTHASTLTDATGAYLLRIPEGDYTLVVFKDGFFPQCRRVTAITGDSITEDFALTAVTSGTLTITVTGLTVEDDSVTVSIRKDGLCGRSLSIFYEVASHSFAEDGSYPISLPPGDYTVVAYGDNLTPAISSTREIESNKNRTITVAL